MERFIVDIHCKDSFVISAMTLQSAVNKIVRMGRSLIANNKNTYSITYCIFDESEENLLRTIMLYKRGRRVVECIF
ncbi:hypothetical protein BF503P4_00001 [Bacteroides phage BF503P4]|nr:hypothetical protein BF503P4_00001 [Bacteroides phage BF503P4]